ncbi:MAG: NAD(P)-binding domain-containing protein, partial [Candidatus Omnitrophica bacterium]|nr:NAD(P)-binding domain-containing protein [Candidatus Omnitrophota bacterium]
MTKMSKIAVIGDGGWGTTLAILLSKKGFDVSLWSAFPEYADLIKKSRENVKFLPGMNIPEGVNITGSLFEALKGGGLVILAVPSQFMRGVLENMKDEDLAGKRFVSATKGIENGTLKRMSEVIEECLGKQKLAVLSGPTIALEVANLSLTSAVIASDDQM